MELSTITQFRNAMMHPDVCLRRCREIACEPDTFTRTQYFAECRAELHGERVMVYAPITMTSMAMVRCAKEALATNNCHTSNFVIFEDEMLCTGINCHYGTIIIEHLPEGTPLSEALYTHTYNNLVTGLETLRIELQQCNVSINHLHPDSIIVDSHHQWHVIRGYYATHGIGGDIEAFDKLKELITRYSISDNATNETLHEEFSYYGVNSDSNLTVYPMCEGLRRFATLTGYGFEDDKGNTVIDAIYHSAQDFIEDRALVESHYGRWGLIDKQGRYIIDMKYDHIEFDVDNGMSEVTLNGHRATFDYFGMQLTPWR